MTRRDIDEILEHGAVLKEVQGALGVGAEVSLWRVPARREIGQSSEVDYGIAVSQVPYYIALVADITEKLSKVYSMTPAFIDKMRAEESRGSSYEDIHLLLSLTLSVYKGQAGHSGK